MPNQRRTVLVGYDRVRGWTERFGDRHGSVTVERTDQRVRLLAEDGAIAEYDDSPPADRFGMVLVRRGGYAVGLVDGTELVASKCGTRYVQGKTKAGGWSQRRYARRRANQAAELADAAGRAVRDVLADAGKPVCFGGGDRALAEAAVDASGLALRFADRWLDVPDPRHVVLLAAIGQARSVPMMLNELA